VKVGELERGGPGTFLQGGEFPTHARDVPAPGSIRLTGFHQTKSRVRVTMVPKELAAGKPGLTHGYLLPSTSLSACRQVIDRGRVGFEETSGGATQVNSSVDFCFQ
jgi:hypothetical protein